MPFESVRNDLARMESLYRLVSGYIDENYVEEEETGAFPQGWERKEFLEESAVRETEAVYGKKPDTVEAFLETLDAGFSETLLTLIDRTGRKDSEVYKKANVDRKLFSKIRNNPAYQPSKTTALAFAFALELNLEETRDFIGRAGYALSHSSKLDLIVEFFLKHENYNVFELNEVLFRFDQPLIGM